MKESFPGRLPNKTNQEKQESINDPMIKYGERWVRKSTREQELDVSNIYPEGDEAPSNRKLVAVDWHPNGDVKRMVREGISFSPDEYPVKKPN